MATITEDYVSYEVAKLLKEKGFDEKVNTHYLVHPSGFSEFFDKKDEFPEPEDVWLKCPTLQMTMKWLREAHKVNIEIHYNRFGENYKYLIIYKPEVLDDIRSLGVYYSYEEAVESAIKYCLENLI